MNGIAPIIPMLFIAPIAHCPSLHRNGHAWTSWPSLPGNERSLGHPPEVPRRSLRRIGGNARSTPQRPAPPHNALHCPALPALPQCGHPPEVPRRSLRRNVGHCPHRPTLHTLPALPDIAPIAPHCHALPVLHSPLERSAYDDIRLSISGSLKTPPIFMVHYASDVSGEFPTRYENTQRVSFRQ